VQDKDKDFTKRQKQLHKLQTQFPPIKADTQTNMQSILAYSSNYKIHVLQLFYKTITFKIPKHQTNSYLRGYHKNGKITKTGDWVKIL
jgi:hypothetical protein